MGTLRTTERHIREYFQSPLLGGDHPIGNEPTKLSDFMARADHPGEYSVFRFETMWGDGDIQNIIQEYIGFLDDPNYIVKVEFDDISAGLFAFKSHSISKWLYGDTTMNWIIFMLNDIQHDSDLSHQFLKSEGVYALTSAGLRALEKIQIYKRRIETQIGTNAFYATSE